MSTTLLTRHDRNVAADRELVELAALAASARAGTDDDRLVADLADAILAAPVPLGSGALERSPADWRAVVSWQLAAAGANAVDGLVSIRSSYERGDAEACDLWTQLVGALAGVVEAWLALHRRTA